MGEAEEQLLASLTCSSTAALIIALHMTTAHQYAVSSIRQKIYGMMQLSRDKQ